MKCKEVRRRNPIPLDIVKSKKRGGIYIVTETSSNGEFTASHIDGPYEKDAWWCPSEVVVLDSIPRLLSRCMAHPFGSNTQQDIRFFPLSNDEKEDESE